MKRGYLLIGLLLSSTTIFAQITNTFPDNGNVGIGITTPAAKLHIGQSNQEIRFDYNGTNDHYGSLRWAALQLGNNGTNRIVAGRTVPGGLLDFYVNNTNDGSNYDIGPNGILAMRINNNGKVGIGTTAPVSELHVNGTTTTSLLTFSEGVVELGYLGRGLATTGAWSLNPDVFALTYQSRDFAIGGWSKSTNTWMGPSFYINSDNGNVGIGTTVPTDKLSVKGKIRSQEIKVENTNWPDYVFTNDYQLPTLQQTENHIKEKGHLPGIPSAAEVKANGIDLGEMNAKLLQKIEELTLHLIHQQKEIEKLKIGQSGCKH
ncbi:hypothetical protein [Pedobacter heparinus]|uniref:Peptidase S74 domain-containing protein n=1 Tax=Pedobacter heparinus (strain ATCC 13125 / DSM 2366 / CIP 104194 / JCM 7457 / NBRC 12017 / NCIMB 9290 / NRRL B-14731 / HIM 762-3) TaxID=485917 RepID=C6Y3J6_PEDHD|nr:hypothetical protein [Pedobacter heparinus]ACU03275.1 hypothetical protein Phep_1056 [Pedobacter heparinus DSM 2366]